MLEAEKPTLSSYHLQATIPTTLSTGLVQRRCSPWHVYARKTALFYPFLYQPFFQSPVLFTDPPNPRYILAVGIGSAAVYSILVPIATDSGLSIATIVEGGGYMFLFFGWGCIPIQAIAQKYGKRPSYLFSLVATMVSWPSS